MNKIKNIFSKNNWSILFLFLIITGCERDLTDEAVFAEFPNNGDVFTDSFSAGLDYFPFVGEGADPEAFTVVTDEVYEGDAAMRFDVPSFGNGFVGATFNTTVKRNLSGFDALTFYAKASQAATINEIGFGIDGENSDRYQTTLNNVAISTSWKKYIIPIPDPSKLINVSGLLWIAEGATNADDEGGYVFWLDEVKFERLGTLAQPQPRIFGGIDLEQPGFLGISTSVTGLSQTYNSASGENITVSTQPVFFNFQSSNTDVAIVDESGVISIIGIGSATITAMINGVEAEGSIQLNVEGGFDFAPIPPSRNPEDVVSVFSDAYNNVPVDYYNGFFNGDGQTTEGGEPPLDISEDNIINYTSLNFVGIGTFLNVSPIDISEMTHLHIDIKPNEAVQGGDFILIRLLNGVQTNNETSGFVQFNSGNFEQDVWQSFDIPIEDFNLSDTSQIGLLFFESGGTLQNIFVDNIYYYRE
ncbi:carbohydrate binding domain-containing protein [Sediminibacter sp. Hel_I_10]|uniref:carbohydrate binding domain-containing protein n=1 Tax=Sediminibacter sp. Hel_I_10 TaxID=1392490 RepID=UPI00069113D3|nr:carbohydrate binding domain-containing protein [Sediminibacter sp. Hel_I_10]